MTGQCPASPVSQAPGSQSKGIPPKQAGEGGNPQSPHRPLLCDMEGNRRERPEYGNKKAGLANFEPIPSSSVSRRGVMLKLILRELYLLFCMFRQTLSR